MKDLCVLGVSVFSAFKVIVLEESRKNARVAEHAEHVEILHSSTFICPLDSLGNLPLLSAPDNLGEHLFQSDC
jgi:hypothetical protein